MEWTLHSKETGERATRGGLTNLLGTFSRPASWNSSSRFLNHSCSLVRGAHRYKHICQNLIERSTINDGGPKQGEIHVRMFQTNSLACMQFMTVSLQRSL